MGTCVHFTCSLQAKGDGLCNGHLTEQFNFRPGQVTSRAL